MGLGYRPPADVSSTSGAKAPDRDLELSGASSSSSSWVKVGAQYVDLDTLSGKLGSGLSGDSDEEPLLPPVRWWAWTHLRDFKGQKLLLWWVGFLFLIGAFFFSFVGITEIIYEVAVVNACGFMSQAAWLIYYPCFIGAAGFFWTASLVNYVEAINQGHDERVAKWLADGCRKPQPRMRLWGAEPRSVYWWAASVQVVGTTLFDVAAIYGVAQLTCTFEVNGPLQRTFQWFPYAAGGTCFLLAGYLFTVSTSGSWWLGVVPLRAAHRRSFMYWSMWFYLVGSCGFCMSGWFFYTAPWLPWGWWALQQFVGYFLGSVCFVVSSYLVLLCVSNPQHA